MRAFLTADKISDRITRVANQPSRSFLLQFPSLMARQWSQLNDTCKDTAGQETTEDECGYPFHCASYGGYGRGIYNGSTSFINSFDADEQGIVIGTDDAAVQPDQYGLISQINSGETSGTVMYCGTYVYGLTINEVTDEAEFYIEALYKNIGTPSITIKEIGIYANGYSPGDSYPNWQQYCILRDVLDTPVILTQGEFLRVRYTIKIAT